MPPDSLVDDLTTSLWQSRAALRSLARRKAWETSIGDCRAIAERQLEHLKRVGVERITRRVAPAHSMGGGVAASTVPPELPIWRGRPQD